MPAIAPRVDRGRRPIRARACGAFAYGKFMEPQERASPAFGHDWTHDLLSFAGLQVAFLVPIECDDDMIGHGQFQTGFKFSAEDLPVRLSATIS